MAPTVGSFSLCEGAAVRDEPRHQAKGLGASRRPGAEALASRRLAPLALPLGWRSSLLAIVAMTAAATCVWRTQVGHGFLPGLFTVVCVPLAVSLFVAVDLRVRFGLAEWIAVIGVIAAHMVLSVPAFPGPLYYRGTHLFRPDHLLHLLAGGLVAWLCFEILEPRAAAWKLTPNRVAVFVYVVTMGFGLAKEVTDFLSVAASGLHYDGVDTVEDLASNALGAGLVVLWRHRHGPRRPGTVGAPWAP